MQKYPCHNTESGWVSECTIFCHLSDFGITITEVKNLEQSHAIFMPEDFFYMKQSKGNGKKRENLDERGFNRDINM